MLDFANKKGYDGEIRWNLHHRESIFSFREDFFEGKIWNWGEIEREFSTSQRCCGCLWKCKPSCLISHKELLKVERNARLSWYFITDLIGTAAKHSWKKFFIIFYGLRNSQELELNRDWIIILIVVLSSLCPLFVEN